MDEKINTKYKDSIFRYLFKEPENFTALYKELTGKELAKDDITFYDTSSIILTKELQNDVSFLTNDNRFIIMVEHQSSLNKNMSIRALLYYAELLKIYIDQQKLNLFSSVPIEIPSAELYVAYNGTRRYEDAVQHLSGHMTIDVGHIKVAVTIKNINYEFIQTKQEKNSFVGYSYWLYLVRKYEKEGFPLKTAFDKAKDICIQEGLLVDYLRRKEFVTMLTKIYTIEDQMLDAKLEGKLEGAQEKAIETAKKALQNHLPTTLIVSLTDLSEAEIQQIKQDMEKEFVSQ